VDFYDLALSSYEMVLGV
jgi:hypothetical protein